MAHIALCVTGYDKCVMAHADEACGVATISRLLKIMSLLQNIVSFVGLFVKRDL